MKKLAIAGSLLAVLALAIMAVGAGSASAVEWLCGGVAKSKCKVDSENLTALVLEDMGANSAVECEPGAVTDEGTAGPGAVDETIGVNFTVSKCKPAAKAENLSKEKVANLCEKVEAMAPVDLPWKTEIEESNWDLISQNGKGQPGYLVECKTIIGKVDDVCTTKEEATRALVELVNLAAEGAEPKLVDGIFLENPLVASQAATCTVGGAENGLVKGEILFAALTEAGALEALEFG
jgi:hypothetical protein